MVMLHIKLKGNDAYSKMVVNSLPTETSSTPGVGSRGIFFYLLTLVMLYIKLKRNASTYSILTQAFGLGSGVKRIFFLKVVMLHIKLKERSVDQHASKHLDLTKHP